MVLLGVLLSPPGPGDIRLGPAQKINSRTLFSIYALKKIGNPGTGPYFFISTHRVLWGKVCTQFLPQELFRTYSLVLTESCGEEYVLNSSLRNCSVLLHFYSPSPVGKSMYSIPPSGTLPYLFIYSHRVLCPNL